MKNNQLLGITGFARSGKSELIKHLEAVHDFHRVGASSLISESLSRENGRTIFTREELREEGIRLRAELGQDFVVKLALGLDQEKIVIDGIRNLRAQRTLIEHGGTMIGLVARPEVRFERAISSSEKIPPSDLNAMVSSEAHEMNSISHNGLQLLPVLWNIPGDAIIDTSDMTTLEVAEAADKILNL